MCVGGGASMWWEVSLKGQGTWQFPSVQVWALDEGANDCRVHFFGVHKLDLSRSNLIACRPLSPTIPVTQI